MEICHLFSPYNRTQDFVPSMALWHYECCRLNLQNMTFTGFSGGASGKEPACQCRSHKNSRFNPSVSKIPWRRVQQPTSVCLPGESHGQRSLEGYSPRVAESDTTEETLHTRMAFTEGISFTQVLILSSSNQILPIGLRGDLIPGEERKPLLLLLTSLKHPWCSPPSELLALGSPPGVGSKTPNPVAPEQIHWVPPQG